MRKLFLVAAAICAFAVTSNNAQADVVVVNFDVTGIQSWDGLGSANNSVINVDLGAGFDNYTITGLGWDVVLESFGASWLSEIRVSFNDSTVGLNLAPGAADGFPGGPTAYSSGGLLDLGSIDPTFPWTQTTNLTTLEFFESFDDVVGAIDGQWVSGTLNIQVERTNNVPEPATATIAGLCLLACGFTRRRRV